MDSVELLRELHNWKSENDEHESEGLTWKTKLNIETQKNFDKLNWVSQGKMPGEIVELLFSNHVQKHIIQETFKYAQVYQNNNF